MVVSPPCSRWTVMALHFYRRKQYESASCTYSVSIYNNIFPIWVRSSVTLATVPYIICCKVESWLSCTLSLESWLLSSIGRHNNLLYYTSPIFYVFGVIWMNYHTLPIKYKLNTKQSVFSVIFHCKPFLIDLGTFLMPRSYQLTQLLVKQHSFQKEFYFRPLFWNVGIRYISYNSSPTYWLYEYW